MLDNTGATSAGGVMGAAGAAIPGLIKDPAFADTTTLENTGGGSTHYTAAAFTQALENIATYASHQWGKSNDFNTLRRMWIQRSQI